MIFLLYHPPCVMQNCFFCAFFLFLFFIFFFFSFLLINFLSFVILSFLLLSYLLGTGYTFEQLCPPQPSRVGRLSFEIPRCQALGGPSLSYREYPQAVVRPEAPDVRGPPLEQHNNDAGRLQQQLHSEYLRLHITHMKLLHIMHTEFATNDYSQ